MRQNTDSDIRTVKKTKQSVSSESTVNADTEQEQRWKNLQDFVASYASLNLKINELIAIKPSGNIILSDHKLDDTVEQLILKHDNVDKDMKAVKMQLNELIDQEGRVGKEKTLVDGNIPVNVENCKPIIDRKLTVVEYADSVGIETQCLGSTGLHAQTHPDTHLDGDKKARSGTVVRCTKPSRCSTDDCIAYADETCKRNTEQKRGILGCNDVAKGVDGFITDKKVNPGVEISAPIKDTNKPESKCTRVKNQKDYEIDIKRGEDAMAQIEKLNEVIISYGNFEIVKKLWILNDYLVKLIDAIKQNQVINVNLSIVREKIWKGYGLTDKAKKLLEKLTYDLIILGEMSSIGIFECENYLSTLTARPMSKTNVYDKE